MYSMHNYEYAPKTLTAQASYHKHTIGRVDTDLFAMPEPECEAGSAAEFGSEAECDASGS